MAKPTDKKKLVLTPDDARLYAIPYAQYTAATEHPLLNLDADLVPDGTDYAGAVEIALLSACVLTLEPKIIETPTVSRGKLKFVSRHGMAKFEFEFLEILDEDIIALMAGFTVTANSTDAQFVLGGNVIPDSYILAVVAPQQSGHVEGIIYQPTLTMPLVADFQAEGNSITPGKVVAEGERKLSRARADQLGRLTVVY